MCLNFVPILGGGIILCLYPYPQLCSDLGRMLVACGRGRKKTLPEGALIQIQISEASIGEQDFFQDHPEFTIAECKVVASMLLRCAEYAATVEPRLLADNPGAAINRAWGIQTLEHIFSQNTLFVSRQTFSSQYWTSVVADIHRIS